ncbi:MAG TPA: ABC transporter permease [Bryobacteraceae bacterium]|nr:ABC transporter permease [Bryobacteraceae bacterium]
MDLKFALRSLRKNPGFALLAVFVMALGVGANTAVFSVVNAVLLKPLAYPDPDRIVTLASLWKSSGGHGQVSAPDFHDWHNESTAFDAMAYYQSGSTAVMPGGAAEYAHVAEVTPEFFQVFGVEPVAGRLFSAHEEKPGSGGAVVISYAYWQSHFGANAQAVGQSVRLLGKSLPIVGVLPPRFHFPNESDIWFPANVIYEETASRGGHNYRVVGRLKPGVSLEQAQAQMTAIGDRLARLYPDSNKGMSVAVVRMRDEMVRNVRLTLYLLLGAVALVLLIGCANVANLLLAKATSRTREIAIRAAVGASRARIVRQLFTESAVLALIAGAAGLLLAKWGSDALVALAPGNVPRLAESGIDAWVLAFTLGLSLAACLLFGLAPALEISRVDLNEALKQGAARVLSGGRSGRMRAALVMTEVALSVVLLAGAGLFIRSFVALHHVALGFQPEHVLVMETSVPAADLAASRRATHLYKDLLADLATLPGVSAVGATRNPPGIVYSDGSYFIDHMGRFTPSMPQAVLSVMAPGALAALGIPIRRGRDFNDGDTYDAPFTAIINEALARKSFPGQDPLGRMIYCGLDSLKPMRIVGVVGDVRQYGPAVPPAPEIIMPYEQHPEPSTALNILVRTTAGTALWGPIQRKVREHSAEVPVKFTSMQDVLAENMAAPRFRTLLLGIFAAIAVCLAMAGVYGVMAFSVGQRANEIGVRMALGANTGDVLRLVLRQGMLLTGIGLAAGLIAAAAATRLLTSMLFEVKADDPLTYLGVAALLATVSLAASYIPARRAARVDPMAALRQD